MARGDEDANADCRYRDYGLLRYWFRSVERFAPWVNRMFFVTCGQKPEWLDENNPRLRLVNHADYIPAACLPTFQSNTIELNLHRIPDLSERFVLLCLNDKGSSAGLERCFSEVAGAFESVLPGKSSFEK